MNGIPPRYYLRCSEKCECENLAGNYLENIEVN
jgi:hypothetical protein